MRNGGMTMADIEMLVRRQRVYFETGKTKSISWRIGALQTLKREIRSRENEIREALQADLKKSGFETYMSETGLVLSELSHMIRHLRGYAKDKTVATPLAQFHAKSFTSAQPYGVTLVMSPWNYPFMLALEPAIGAIGSRKLRCHQAECLCTAHLICDRGADQGLFCAAFCSGGRGWPDRKYAASGTEI